MAKSDDQKLKILYIRDYLERCSHENHPVSTAELLVFLDSKGISCERKTIYRDIAALQEYGLDIVQKKGKSGGYYIATRNFELPELKLLVDAVQSSRFLTAKKSMELIQKLCSQCSHYEEELMRRDILVSGRVKSMNESAFTIMWTRFKTQFPKICRLPSAILTGALTGSGTIAPALTPPVHTACAGRMKTIICWPTPSAMA